ncbi:MAG: hypothetical protein LBM27_05010 [Lactobacillaceae bacterium]|jgi:hypothetical protein|nr:hypothetical protein [Lactobacillaceae bacterium]
MKKKFTTYYIKYSYNTFTSIFLTLSFFFFNVIMTREIYAPSTTLIILWVLFAGVLVFQVQRKRLFVNNTRLFLQGTYLKEDIDIDLEKISKLKINGHVVEFQYKNKPYKLLSSKKFAKYIQNVAN